MITLVTGANGHLGANLVRALLERGETVRVFVRKGSNHQAIEGLDVECAYGDIRDIEALAAAVKGCRRVYHLAANVSLRRSDLQLLYDVNVLGTRNVLRAAAAMGVERVMYASSFGAVGHNPDGPSDESWTINPFRTHLYYDASKAFAEHEVLRAVAEGLDAVMVNPVGIIGPNDYVPSAVGQTIIDYAHGRLYAYPNGVFDFVTARDAVAGCIAAMEKGRTGQRYILSGEYISLEQTLIWIGECFGKRPPKLKIPYGTMRIFAAVKDPIEARFFPRNIPRFTKETTEMLYSGKRADNTRMRTELGVEPTSCREAFHEQVAWFRRMGKIP